jgi:hypothetical protein
VKRWDEPEFRRDLDRLLRHARKTAKRGPAMFTDPEPPEGRSLRTSRGRSPFAIEGEHQASLVGGARQHARTPSRGRKPAPGALFRVFARPPAKAPRRGHAFAAATSCFAPFLGRLSKRLLGRLSKRLLGRLSKRLLGRLSQRLLGRLSRGFRQRGGRPRQHLLSRGDRVAHVRGRVAAGPSRNADWCQPGTPAPPSSAR